MTRRRSGWRRPWTGQGVVEFSLVSLTLMMLTLGIADLGRAVFHRTLLTNAVREATRYGQVNDRADLATYRIGVVAAAANRSPSLGLTTSNVTIACSSWSSPTDGTDTYCTTANVKERLTVCIDLQFGLTAPRLIGLSTIPMRECARATLR